MTFTPLSTDFKDEILSEVNTQRKYKQTVNEDGTVSLQDMTAYEQEGSTYSAKILTRKDRLLITFTQIRWSAWKKRVL